VAAGKAGEVRDAAGRGAATNPALVPQATVSAQAAGIKSRMWQDSAVLTVPVQNVERG
jgi:hypothetical protein